MLWATYTLVGSVAVIRTFGSSPPSSVRARTWIASKNAAGTGISVTNPVAGVANAARGQFSNAAPPHSSSAAAANSQLRAGSDLAVGGRILASKVLIVMGMLLECLDVSFRC